MNLPCLWMGKCDRPRSATLTSGFPYDAGKQRGTIFPRGTPQTPGPGGSSTSSGSGGATCTAAGTR